MKKYIYQLLCSLFIGATMVACTEDYMETDKGHGDFSSYWMQSSLKISPVEQVELLKNLYRNNFNFTPANIHAVKNSIHLTASENGEFMEKPEPDE